MKRLHVTGCPRSGTTLMIQLIATCFKNDGYYHREMSIFEEPEPGCQLFLSKKPTDIRHIKRILEADKNLFILYMIRDPRDSMTSIHSAQPDRYFSNFRVWKECADSAKTIETSHRFISIRYEALVAEPDAVQAQLMTAFPFLEKIHDFSSFEQFSGPSKRSAEAMGGLRPVSAASIGNWKKHLPRVKAQILLRPDLADALITYGYEKDNSWQQILTEVEPDFGPGRHVENKPMLKTFEARLRTWWKIKRYLWKLRALS
jgi:hypothetical protein